jgi:hypothetical protein
MPEMPPIPIIPKCITELQRGDYDRFLIMTYIREKARSYLSDRLKVQRKVAEFKTMEGGGGIWLSKWRNGNMVADFEGKWAKDMEKWRVVGRPMVRIWKNGRRIWQAWKEWEAKMENRR